MAYDFDGSSQYLINDSWTEATGTPFTLAAWMNIDTAADKACVGLQSTSVTLALSLLTPRFTGIIGAGTLDAVSYDQGTAGSYSTGTWFHGAAVFASATSRTAYLNGSAGSENTVSRSPASFDRIVIGASKLAGGAASDYLDAKIAEVAVWNVALSADEIVSLAKGFKPSRVRPQSLKFYAPLVADIRDLAKGLTLTNTGTATVTTHTRVY